MTYEDYAKRAVELGHSILSSCEHGWQGRYIECYDLAKQYGLKFLFAAEAYWVWDRHEEDRSNCHIWVGAKNENGREWINEVLSQANEDGFYYQPRLDEELLDLLPAGDVWITTACVAGWKYLGEEEERLKTLWKKLYDKHGDNFMFEVQYHPSERQKELNRYILNLRRLSWAATATTSRKTAQNSAPTFFFPKKTARLTMTRKNGSWITRMATLPSDASASRVS